MRLQNTPPKGAGKSQGVTKTERLVQIIEGLGQDKATFLPMGIRSSELAERAGVPRGSVQALLADSVDSGRLQCCKVTVPGSPPQNEYRKGTGVPMPEFQPLNTKRAGIARNTPHVRPESSIPPVAVSQPADKREPEVPVFLKSNSSTPQPAVGNTGSAQSEPTSADERAVASSTETPGPQPERRGMGPAPARAPAGDVVPRQQRINGNDGIALRIDHDGTLLIATDEGVLEIGPKQSRRLGHFMADTHGVWNPF